MICSNFKTEHSAVRFIIIRPILRRTLDLRWPSISIMIFFFRLMGRCLEGKINAQCGTPHTLGLLRRTLDYSGTNGAYLGLMGRTWTNGAPQSLKQNSSHKWTNGANPGRANCDLKSELLKPYLERLGPGQDKLVSNKPPTP